VVRKYTVFSLFSGAGGMDAGFLSTKNFQLLLANDILSVPGNTYSSNFGHKIVDVSEVKSFDGSFPLFLLGDIDDIDFDKVSVQDLDVIIGGPPCQDFSIVRGPQVERQGIEVKRGRLYAHFIKALIHLQPKIFVFENVPGLKSANAGKAYQTILQDFSRLRKQWSEIRKIVGNTSERDIKDYVVIFSNIVNAADLGVPQRRRRLIIIGVRADLIDITNASELIRISENLLYGYDSIFKKYPLTPLEVFEGRALPELSIEYKNLMEQYSEVADKVRTPRAKWWKDNIWKKLSFDPIEDYIAINKIAPADRTEVEQAFEEHKRLLKEIGYLKSPIEGKDFPDRSNCIPNEAKEVLDRLKMIPPDENHTFVAGTNWEVEGKGMSLIYRRIHPLKPSYTVVAYGGGGTWGYHYRRDRGKLTNRERARLQTFPDSFIFKGSSAEIRAQIGEAVPPLLGRRIAEVVSTILTKVKS